MGEVRESLFTNKIIYPFTPYYSVLTICFYFITLVRTLTNVQPKPRTHPQARELEHSTSTLLSEKEQ